MSDYDYTLQVPVDAHGETVTNLVLKRPTGEQVGRLGLPYVVVGEAPDFKMAVVMKYIVVLAGVPDSTVRQMDPVDLNSLAWAICGFFLVSATQPQN
ncbi:MAG: phage tail assembly protein [Pseudomonadota bacterium]